MDHVEDDPRELARKIEQADRIASRMLDQTTVERLKSWATVLRDRLKRILRERRIREEIAARARDLWDQNGRPEGRDLEFWLQAERETRDRYRESSGK
jgi:Protein of unknown function (DUF2934)